MSRLNINLTSSQIITLFLKNNRETLFTNSWTTARVKKSAMVSIYAVENMSGEGEIEFRVKDDFYKINKGHILFDLKNLTNAQYFKMRMTQKTTNKDFIVTIRFSNFLDGGLDKNGSRYFKVSYVINELR